MDKPNLMESVEPGSGQYSFKTDLRLNAWLGVATAVYLATFALLRQHPDWSPLLRGLLALTPLIPSLLYVRSCMRFVRDLDELQRRVQVEVLLFSALGTVMVGATVDTLEAQDVPMMVFDHGLGFGGALFVMFTLWLVGTAIANWRYK